ncbi:MAG: hypothetical protein Q8P18_17755 [Pseudomonadota bacterium]|nr:hypothetical protein [Pseudomonadota bacterium]
MARGYQIIEPAGLDRLLGAPPSFPVGVALLYWLIEQLKLELGPRLDGLEVEVIRVEYHGAYPALGVHYREEVGDIAPLLERTIDRLLRDRPVASFVAFLVDHPADWGEVCTQLLAGRS